MSARVQRALVGLIRLYRAALSPLLPPSCRYAPTCSRYAEEAVRRFGPWRGGWLALRRLLRCHPFGGRGWDPVPPAPTGSGEPTSPGAGEAGEAS